ncbi:MYCBP-associated protein [Tiliqua scincoides]|uniref:MYCBP-associated protein n=1 Tax=Tiliqua scincoides TaxID=71010 RepID=UPI0034632952
MIKPGKKESRNSKTPPDKRRAKAFEQPSSPVQEEPEPVSYVLQGDEIQALAIKLEELEKLHTARFLQEEKPTVTKKYLIRRSRPQEVGKKAHLLVAYPVASDDSKKALHYSGLEGPIFDSHGQVLPHSILGTVQEFKQEAVARGHVQIARLIPDVPQLANVVSFLGKYREIHEERKKTTQPLSSQHGALQNWLRNMTLRKKQHKRLCECVQKSESQLLMNLSDNYRRIQEERTLIDQSLPALYSGKGNAGNEFWLEPVHIGEELTGLTVTPGMTERGYPEEIIRVGKPRSICLEMGTKATKYRPWEKSLFLKQRRKELKEILEQLDFYHPDLDGLEVISKNQPFVSVSTQNFTPCDEDKESLEQEESKSPLEDYPDVFLEPVLGPSMRFCGEPARWLDTSHEGEVGITTRITFEILVGEKAESHLTISNDGTAAIWYDWRRRPQHFTFEERKKRRFPNFYFNTKSGIILPGETKKFSFIFKAMNAGIFSESWEFGTQPVLLGGAVLQVTLWGVAVYEDISAGLREELQKELDDQEVAVIVEENLKNLLDRIRTPRRLPSPLDEYITEEEIFHRRNPELHYQHQVVQGLHDLWNKLVNPPPTLYVFEGRLKSLSAEESSAPKSAAESPHKGLVEAAESRKSSSSAGKKSLVGETLGPLNETGAELEDMNRVEWNLSIADFKQTVLEIPVEEDREAALAQLNKAVLELSTVELPPQTDILYQICFQLWREVIDGLVSHSLVLRSLLGMPEKDTYVETVPEEPVEVKPVVTKGGKEDRKVQKEDKKAAAKEKGKTSKEERQNSRKAKGKEERKSRTSTREAKESVPPVADVPEEPPEPRQEQVDPIVQEKYHEKLYVEVYELLNSMMSKMVFLFEQVKKDDLEKNKEPVI